MFSALVRPAVSVRTAFFSNVRNLAVSASLNTKVAVILSGSGVYDGSETTETTSCLIHLSKAGADVSMFAPNKNQAHVIDHTKGEEAAEKRNVLTESARIARGNIKELSELNPSEFEAVILPGGFGAAKNLSTFAFDGAKMSVDGDLCKILREFHIFKKPIGLCCIAPVIAAKIFPGCEVTVGSDKESEHWPFAGAAQAITAMGACHVCKTVAETHIDRQNNLVSTPAYMNGTAKPHEVYEGIGNFICEMMAMTQRTCL